VQAKVQYSIQPQSCAKRETSPVVSNPPSRYQDNLANLAEFAQRNFAHSRQFESILSRYPDKTATSQRAFGNLDLVNLAREILEGTGGGLLPSGEIQTRTKMAATTEQSANVQPESPTSRFTAVNGKEQPAGATNSNGTARRGSDERSNGQPRITPPGQEKLTITTSTRDDWAPPANNGDRHSYQPPGAYSDPDASHKRKRSGSIEQNSSSANSYHSHALPSSTKQTPTTATTESDEPRQDNQRAPPHPEHRDAYNSEMQYRQFIASTEDHRDPGPRNSEWHHGYQQQPIPSDEHIGEVLQRGLQNMDAQQRGYISPGDDDRSGNPYGGYGNDRREMSASSDPKKRKRNFSNRTKTGCMTCRRRKKKCDETRPECSLLFRFHGREDIVY
jgi:hypothetical protein